MLISPVGATPSSPARRRDPTRRPLRIGAIQERWNPDRAVHEAALERGVRMAADEGARVVCLPELTLTPYFASDPKGPSGDVSAESLDERSPGPTLRFASRLSRALGIFLHASLYEHQEASLGFNTAILVGPDGSLVSRTRKLHIPVTAGYHENRYFEPGPSDQAFPVVEVEGACFGFPTCWDQWFGEVSRAYAIAGAEILVYPTAIGSEPDHPDFDTAPLWEQVMVGNGIQNGLFTVAVNRIGLEPPITFYGSSFIADPYGRKLVSAPRDRSAVLVADLDLDQRRDWLELFPFLETRRPDAYASLTAEGVSTRRP